MDSLTEQALHKAACHLFPIASPEQRAAWVDRIAAMPLEVEVEHGSTPEKLREVLTVPTRLQSAARRVIIAAKVHRSTDGHGLSPSFLAALNALAEAEHGKAAHGPPWSLERPGVLRLDGTDFTVAHGGAGDGIGPRFWLRQPGKTINLFPTLAEAKAFAEQYVSELREMGLLD